MALILPIIVTGDSWSQKLVCDSLILNLQAHSSENIQLPFQIDTVFDLRANSTPDFIGFDEVHRYSIIPVDLYIRASKPLAKVFKCELSKQANNDKPTFSLGINHFEISRKSTFSFIKRYKINSLISIYSIDPEDNNIPQGEIILDSDVHFPWFKNKIKKGYETAFQKLIKDMSVDLSAAAQHIMDGNLKAPYNYRPRTSGTTWMQLKPGADFIVTADGFLIDAHLHFVYPEAKRLSINSNRLIRFRHQKLFDSIEYGIINNSISYRANPDFIFHYHSNFLIGMNRWKDMAYVKHKLYDAVIADFSMSQNLHFHPKYSRTLTLGMGVSQSLNYIYSKGFQFQLGLLIHLGMQL